MLNSTFQEMIDDMEKQSKLYKPTTFWEEASKTITEELKNKDIKNFRKFTSAISMFAPTYAFPKYLKDRTTFDKTKASLKITTSDVKSIKKLDLLISGEIQAFSDYRVFISSNKNIPPYLDMVSESDIGNPLEQFNFDGKKFSRSFLNYLLGLNFLKKHVDTSKIKNVLEIGGGYGTLGEILLSDDRNNCFYINIDIPPVVHFSSYYLQKLFGESNIGTYSQFKNSDIINIDKLKEKYKALNLCSWQISKLKGKVDLFVNFISFQEMEPDVVKNYCKHISDLSPEYILLRNIKEGKKIQDKTHIYGVKEPILGNNYDDFLPKYKLLKTDNSIFGLKMEDNFHSQLRLYIKKSGNN